MMASVNPNAVAQGIAFQAAVLDIPQFLMVSATLINGKSWCGDCRKAEPLIEKKFPGAEAARLTVQYAGEPEK